MRATLIAAAALVSIAVLLPGCSTGASPASANAPTGQPLQMSPGQQIGLPGGATLRYLEVTADSRCPPGVQCIHAGSADVAFQFTDVSWPAGQAARRITVNTELPATATIGRWQLQLISLAFGDQPRATVQIDPTAR